MRLTVLSTFFLLHNNVITAFHSSSLLPTHPISCTKINTEHNRLQGKRLKSTTHYYLENLTANNNKIITCDALGGTIKQIKLENESDGFLTKNAVPTYASYHGERNSRLATTTTRRFTTRRKGLEEIVPGAFLVENAISKEDCANIIETCENAGLFGRFHAGKNNHSAMQILVTQEAANTIGESIFPHIDVNAVNRIARSLPHCDDDVEYVVAGLNRRWRIYRYEPGGQESFAPHIDAGFPPSSLSEDGSTLIWDASNNFNGEYAEDTVSRLTVLMYLSDAFEGGHTNFFSPLSEGESAENAVIIAAVKPKVGRILLFPQAVGEENVEYARFHWPLHEGSPVTSSSGNEPKYVIRSDILFTTNKAKRRSIS